MNLMITPLLVAETLFSLWSVSTWPLSTKIAVGAGLLGALAGLVGSYGVLRRRALLGDVLAHAALPGICLAFLLTGVRSTPVLAAGALATGVASVFCVALAVRWTRTREDAAMGVVLSTFFGAGVLLLTVIQAGANGSQAGIDSYLFGEIASLRASDITVLVIATAVAALACLLLHKELKLFCFDEGFARSQGWPTVWIDFGVMSAVAVVVVLGLPVCGVVLIAAMLIFPAAAARYWTDRLSRVVVLSALVGATAGAGGVLLASPAVPADSFLGSLVRDADGGLPPPGPIIVLTGTVLFCLSVLFAPSRGVLAAAWRQANFRRRVQREHLLRSLYELIEKKGPIDREILPAELATRYRAEPWTYDRTLRRADRAGLIRRDGETVRLTSAGSAEAQRLTRKHRLWELFLVRQADIAADHVDRDADDVEHALPPELVKQLATELAADEQQPVPPSPHRIDT